jgi:hypothetical protein
MVPWNDLNHKAEGRQVEGGQKRTALMIAGQAEKRLLSRTQFVAMKRAQNIKSNTAPSWLREAQHAVPTAQKVGNNRPRERIMLEKFADGPDYSLPRRD